MKNNYNIKYFYILDLYHFTESLARFPEEEVRLKVLTEYLTQAMQQAIFADYVQYQDADLESHIQQFHKQTVLKQYLRMMESAA